jgi:hypothetical protein
LSTAPAEVRRETLRRRVGLAFGKGPEASDAALFASKLGIDPDPWQADLLRSPVKQMILNCSRQAGKSTVSSVLALHQAVYNPDSLVLVLSPSLRQSQELFKKIRDNYRTVSELAPLFAESALRLEYENGSRIICLPGNEAKIRGFSGVALLLVDEASRVPDELYYSVRPMLAVSGGRLVLLSTPFGKRGFFHKEWEEGGDDWHRARVTAYDCPRIPKDWLDQERRAIGEWWFKQEYGCEFVETIDSVFRYDDIRRAFEDVSVKPLFGEEGGFCDSLLA